MRGAAASFDCRLIEAKPVGTHFVMIGRVEAVADLRNLLAQGYLPLMMSGGQQVLLVDSPRSFRGGLAFTF